MLKRASLIVLLAVAMLFPLAPFAHAQVDNEVAVSVSPTNPGPNESVTVTLTSYSFDLETAQINWSATGQRSASGIGDVDYTFTTGGLGSATTINVTITPVGSVDIQKTIVITPMTVDMLWQATDSIVPPFYRGKAMPTSESEVKFVAIPQIKSSNGSYIAPGNFVYDWSENYTADANDSGYGKNGYTTFMDYLNPDKYISVDVSSQDGGLATSGNITLSPVDPKIVWYASSPLYGPLYGAALDGSYPVVGNDTSLIAEPYFFSPATPLSKELSYAWTLNGDTISTPSIPNMLALHRSTSDTGTATLSVEVTSLNKLFQDSTANLTLSLQ